MVEVIRVRLRKKKDDDLRAAFNGLSDDRSDVIRAALRAYLFNRPDPSTISTKPVPKLEKMEKPDAAVTGGLDDLLGNF
jgi:Arc/MetJ-type ribon-helix-helix transcriptional regulator